ncbi:MAG: DUF1320 domain-containing protein [Pseudomonadota bacterium]
MTYATQTDLIDRFGSKELMQLTDRSSTPATRINATVVARALTDATALADSYLGKRYQLPITGTVPPTLTKVTADIARYFLHGDSVEKDDPVDIAHRDAMRWLKDVSTGMVSLEVAGVEAPSEGGGGVRVEASDRIFSRASLRDF